MVKMVLGAKEIHELRLQNAARRADMTAAEAQLDFAQRVACGTGRIAEIRRFKGFAANIRIQ